MHGPQLSAEALDAAPFAAAVARELLRITPAVPAVFRIALEDFELAGRRVPKVRAVASRCWGVVVDALLRRDAVLSSDAGVRFKGRRVARAEGRFALRSACRRSDVRAAAATRPT